MPRHPQRPLRERTDGHSRQSRISALRQLRCLSRHGDAAGDGEGQQGPRGLGAHPGAVLVAGAAGREYVDSVVAYRAGARRQRQGQLHHPRDWRGGNGGLRERQRRETLRDRHLVSRQAASWRRLVQRQQRHQGLPHAQRPHRGGTRRGPGRLHPHIRQRQRELHPYVLHRRETHQARIQGQYRALRRQRHHYGGRERHEDQGGE